MFENVISFFKRVGKKDKLEEKSKNTAKERLHLVLMQDRANVSADFLDMMRQEIIEVIKKYIDVDENDIDVRLTNKVNEDGSVGAPALYANIPIAGVKENAAAKVEKKEEPKKEDKPEEKAEPKEENTEKEEKTEAVEDNKKDEEIEEVEDNTEGPKEEEETVTEEKIEEYPQTDVKIEENKTEEDSNKE